MRGDRSRDSPLRLLLSRFGGVAGSLVLGQIVLGVAYVVAARSITPAVLGVIATCVAIATIAAIVFDAGLNDLMVREVASGQLERHLARGTVRAKRRLSPILLLVVLGASVALAPTLPSGLLLGCLGVAVWEAQTANGLLRGREQFAKAATSQVSGRVTGLVVVVVAALAGGAEMALPAGLLVGYAVEAALGRVFLGRPGCPARSQREVLPLYRAGVSFGLSSLAASAQQLDTPLVTLGAGPAAAGLYAAAGRLLGPLGFLPTALGLVGAPWLARAKHDPIALLGEERRILRIASVICVAPLLVAALGPLLIPVLLGDEYRSSGTVFAVLAIGSVFSTLNQPLAVITQNRGRQQKVATIVAIGLGIGLAATFALAVAGGAVWAAAGFTISQLYILAHLGLTVRRLRRVHPDPEPPTMPFEAPTVRLQAHRTPVDEA